MAIKRTKDGSVDLRTKEGKEIANRMAKAREARKSKNSIVNRFVRLFTKK